MNGRIRTRWDRVREALVHSRSLQLFIITAIIFLVASLTLGRRFANTGNVRIGPDNSANAQPIVLTPGDEYVLEGPNGTKQDFDEWFLDADTSGDGVVIIYF